jgi:CO dehydrogenase maturation factor
MKIAVSGKGGSGKTTVSGTLSRVLAAQDYDVLAIDDDENPNLSLTVGIPREKEVPPIPGDLLQRVELPSGETELELVDSVEEIINNYGVAAPDGIQLLKMGEVDHAGSGCMCSAHSTAREVLSNIVEKREEVTIMDMVAGVEHLGRGTTKDVDILLVVVEPYYKSLETGRRTRDLAEELGIPEIKVVANKVRDDQDRDAIEEFCENNDLEITSIVPFDDSIRRADQQGTAPYDHDKQAPAMTAVRELAEDLVSEHA